MNFQPFFLRIATVVTASLLLIIATGAARSVCSTNAAQPESAAEHYVLKQLETGRGADLQMFTEDQRKLSASFIAKLWTSRDVRIHPRGIVIYGAVIIGRLDLSGQEIPHHVSMVGCRFEGSVNLAGSHFAKGLSIFGSRFKEYASFAGANIALDFIAEDCEFPSAEFERMQVDRNFLVARSTFGYSEPLKFSYQTSFQGTRVGRRFAADESIFLSQLTSFDDMQVDGEFSARRCTFSFRNTSQWTDPRRGEATVTFIGGHFADFFLNDSSFDTISTIDFTRMQADLISFDGVKLITPSEVRLQQLSFKVVSPVNASQLQFLLTNYNDGAYSALETSFRTQGYPDEADKIFLAKKRAERSANCKDFLHQCERGAWTLSVFQDAVAGYGKNLQNLLYWSLGFLAIGMLVFRSEKGMRPKDWNRARQYVGRYHPFWYSLDLFLPIIKLGEADVWTPKDNRRWANLYKKVHIIIGSLFVPIGLAAWTGIIK